MDRWWFFRIFTDSSSFSSIRRPIFWGTERISFAHVAPLIPPILESLPLRSTLNTIPLFRSPVGALCFLIYDTLRSPFSWCGVSSVSISSVDLDNQFNQFLRIVSCVAYWFMLVTYFRRNSSAARFFFLLTFLPWAAVGHRLHPDIRPHTRSRIMQVALGTVGLAATLAFRLEFFLAFNIMILCQFRVEQVIHFVCVVELFTIVLQYF